MLVSFVITVTKYMAEKTLREERFILLMFSEVSVQYGRLGVVEHLIMVEWQRNIRKGPEQGIPPTDMSPVT
jgi:hypothetical protein